MTIIWWDEAGDGAGIMTPPAGAITVTRLEASGDDWHVWFTRTPAAREFPNVTAAWVTSATGANTVSAALAGPAAGSPMAALIRRAMITAKAHPGRMVIMHDDGTVTVDGDST
jgi:hypothetical protein